MQLKKVSAILESQQHSSLDYARDSAEAIERGLGEIKSVLESGVAGIESLIDCVDWWSGRMYNEALRQTAALERIEDNQKRQYQLLAIERLNEAESRKTQWIEDGEPAELNGPCRTDRFSRMESLYLEAMDIYGSDWRAYIGLADLYVRGNRFGEAMRYLEESLWLRLRNSERGLVQRLMGRIRYATGDYEGAMRLLEAAAGLCPDHLPTQYDLAQYLALTGHEEECLAGLECLLQANLEYWYLIRQESSFDGVRQSVMELVGRVLECERQKTLCELAKAQAVLDKDLSGCEESLATIKLCNRRLQPQSRVRASQAVKVKDMLEELRCSLAKCKVSSDLHELVCARSLAQSLPIASGEMVLQMRDLCRRTADDTVRHLRTVSAGLQERIDEWKQDSIAAAVICAILLLPIALVCRQGIVDISTRSHVQRQRAAVCQLRNALVRSVLSAKKGDTLLLLGIPDRAVHTALADDPKRMNRYLLNDPDPPSDAAIAGVLDVSDAPESSDEGIPGLSMYNAALKADYVQREYDEYLTCVATMIEEGVIELDDRICYGRLPNPTWIVIPVASKCVAVCKECQELDDQLGMYRIGYSALIVLGGVISGALLGLCAGELCFGTRMRRSQELVRLYEEEMMAIRSSRYHSSPKT